MNTGHCQRWVFVFAHKDNMLTQYLIFHCILIQIWTLERYLLHATFTYRYRKNNPLSTIFISNAPLLLEVLSLDSHCPAAVAFGRFSFCFQTRVPVCCCIGSSQPTFSCYGHISQALEPSSPHTITFV